jgi:hypothetical protein
LSTSRVAGLESDEFLKELRQTAPREMAALRALWRRWSSVVSLFAYRRSASRHLDEAAYAELFARLVEACRAGADSDDVARAAYFQALEELVRPWMDPRTLARTDRASLTILLDRCRQVERDLAGRPSAPLAIIRSLALLLPIAAGVGLAPILWPRIQGSSVWNHANHWITYFGFHVSHPSFLQTLAVFTIAMVGFGIIQMRRVAKY